MARKDEILRIRDVLLVRRDALRRALSGDLSLLSELRDQGTGDVIDAALDSAQGEINSQLAEGESLGSIWKWILVGGGLVFGAMTLALLPDSLCFAIPVVIIAGVVYVLIKRSGKPSDQAFFDAGTRGSLALLRIVGWRKMEWPFPKVPSYSAKGTNFDDKDLASMSDVGEIEALDLDGCAITDAGLVHLAAWTQLRYLVLTNTSVTREAAIELQNKLNKTMVWL